MFSGVRIDLVYQYHFPISCCSTDDILCAYLLDVLSPACDHLTSDSCMLLLAHQPLDMISLITCHLAWLLDLWLSHLRGSCLDFLYYIQWPVILYYIYSDQNLYYLCTPATSWTCPAPAIPV